MSSRLLPEPFADLEGFANDWALATESERVAKRYASSMAELQSFYDAMLPRVEAMLEHLNRFSLEGLPEPEQRLLYLTFSLAEASLPVEIFGEPQVPYGFDPARYGLELVDNPTRPKGWANVASRRRSVSLRRRRPPGRFDLMTRFSSLR